MPAWLHIAIPEEIKLILTDFVISFPLELQTDHRGDVHSGVTEKNLHITFLLQISKESPKKIDALISHFSQVEPFSFQFGKPFLSKVERYQSFPTLFIFIYFDLE